jgi:hypothetical protein
MRTTTARRTITKLLLTTALVGGAATVAGIGTFGAFTDTTSADTAVSAGKVSVQMNGSEAGIHLEAKNMADGDNVMAPITIQRPADSLKLGDVQLTTTTTGSTALLNSLRLTVDSCQQPWTVSGTTMTCGRGQTNLSTNGPLGDNGSTSAWGQTKDWLAALNSSTPIYLRVTLNLNGGSNNALQNQAAGVTWKLTGTQRTATTTVVTPTAVS